MVDVMKIEEKQTASCYQFFDKIRQRSINKAIVSQIGPYIFLPLTANQLCTSGLILYIIIYQY